MQIAGMTLLHDSVESSSRTRSVGRKAVTGKRRNDYVEGIFGVPAMCCWIGEWPNDLQLLDHGSRPTLRDAYGIVIRRRRRGRLRIAQARRRRLDVGCRFGHQCTLTSDPTLGSGKWSGGPIGIVMTQDGRLVFGRAPEPGVVVRRPR